MIGAGIVSKQTGVPGWHSDQEAEKLIELARQYVPDGGVVVELGGEYGKSASEFGYALKAKKDIRIFTVDLFPVTHHLAAQHGGLLNVWRSNLAETGLGGHHLLFIPVPGDSWEIGNNWNEPIDLLFIDGDHTYEGVTKDIHAWVNHVNNGGAVAFHDVWKNENSHPVHKEVLRAVEDYFGNTTKEWERHDAPDSLLYFVRKVATQKTVERGAGADQPDEKAAAPAAKKKSTAKSVRGAKK